jgi:hypothetical protein
MNHQQLVRYDAMCSAIEAAHKVDEVKDIRDKAAALEHYARQAQNTDAERQAAEIRLRAERKAGQLLAKMPKAKPGRKTGYRSTEMTDIPKLEELGVSKNQSSQWQKLGALPQREFNLAIGSAVSPPTTQGILRQASESAKPDKPRGKVVAKEALWLWGRLLDFERDGLLDMDPSKLIKTMTEPMKDDTHRLAPKVARWLKQIGAL